MHALPEPENRPTGGEAATRVATADPAHPNHQLPKKDYDGRLARYEKSIAEGNDAYNEIMLRITPRERAFVEHYCEHFNGRRAAKEAGYADSSAQQISISLRQRPIIKKALELHAAMIAGNMKMSAARTMHALETIAFSDIRDVVSWNEEGEVSVKPSADISDDVAMTIQEIQMTQGRFGPQLKIKQVDKMTALQMLARITELAKPEEKSPEELAATAAVNKLASAINRALDNVYGTAPEASASPLVEEGAQNPTPPDVIEAEFREGD